MDVVVRRCPFLARVPQAFFQQARKNMVVYAQQCPIMMDLASKPLGPTLVRALCSSSSHQKTEDIMSAGPNQLQEEVQLPPNHPMPPSGQAAATKCPFLAAEMGQKNSSVVREVSMELQEDVQEVRTVQNDVSPALLKQPSVTNTNKVGGGDRATLMKNLLKQRPKRVSHLLQDNLPSHVSSFHYDGFF
jgi:5-aminolevulinate synthase